jgi:hypothetical protein
MATAPVALAAGATLITTVFTVAMADRWLARRRPHELAWTLSLAQFSIASGALWLGVTTGWTAGSFRVFYLFGAILNVPWLALGSVLLLNGGQRGKELLVGFGLGSTFIAGLLAVIPLKGAVIEDDLPVGREVFGVLPRVLAAVGSGLAATVIIGLALWSAARLLRGGRTLAIKRLAAGNLIIALGTTILSLSGAIAGRVGKTNAFALSLVAGIAVLFAGFVVATGNPGTAARSAKQSAQHLAAQAFG